jgi:hypothetical protein
MFDLRAGIVSPTDSRATTATAPRVGDDDIDAISTDADDGADRQATAHHGSSRALARWWPRAVPS